MTERLKNYAASIHARLSNEARRLKRPFSEILQYYGIERFLYRLFKTKYANNFILKGGLIFTIWGIPLRRPTRDIDFLGSLDNRKETILEVMKATVGIQMPEDGVTFDINTVVIEERQVDADRVGIRANLVGYLGRAEIPIQIDIGFSDEITSSPEKINYPTLLSDMSGPILRGYPPEAVVSEKFHATVRFTEAISRWKDYYDIWLISGHFEFDSRSLQKALVTTFEKRNTEIPRERPKSLTIEFANEHQEDWKRFLVKNGLEQNGVENLPQVVEKIWSFLEWPLGRFPTQNSPQDPRNWQPDKRTWAS